MRVRAVALSIGVLGATLAANAGEPACPRYGPVPSAIEALSRSATEERLATEAIVALEDRDPAVAGAAARRLLLARNAGLHRAVERLARGSVPDRVLLHLLEVVSASPLDLADAILAVAVDESRPEARAIATLGLAAGRTGAAIDGLARLARDPAPCVRAAALRALYALESPAALAARRALGTDPDPGIATLRLRLQRLRGESDPAARADAVRAWLGGRTATERLAGMRLLASFGPDAPRLALASILGELAGPPDAVDWVRATLRWPTQGYPAAESRLAAAEALVARLRDPGVEPEERDRLLRIGTSWLGRSVHERPGPSDEEARALLRAALPDSGAPLVEPVVRALQRNEFEEPSHGVRLLLARPRDAALEALRGLVLAPQGLDPDVLSAVSGGFRDLRRIGDDAAALRLTHPARPGEVRADAVLALEDEDAERALPLLAALVRDGDATVASHAASVLEARGGPRERALLEASLLDAVWRPFEQDVLDFLVAPADDAVFAFLVRAVRTGSKPLKEAIFQSLAHPRSPVRGRRALAIVHLAIEDPALGIDTGTIGKAIAAVDSRAAVAFIGSRWRGWRSPGILVRNLRVSTGPAPREFALRLAEEIPDGDAGMLVELATVLAEACEKAPERTDPFWRRLLSSRSEELVRVAVGHLRRVPHGPMSDLLVPLLADRSEDAGLRREALLALAGEAGEPPTSLLWAIASDRLEDSDLREACAVALLPRADPGIREQALAWLSGRPDEPSGAVVRIAELAGRGATAAQAADLLQLLEDDLSERYAHRPYFHTRDEQPDALRAYRMAALVRGLGASDDDPSLDALADLLFDPRFAAYSAEARRREALRRRPGGGPLCAVEDPPEIEILLHQAGESPNETPASPIPPEASEIADAMARRGVEEGARRVAAAIDRAATTGRLALFNDVYVLWLANRLRQGGRDAVSRGAGPEAESAAAALDGALALTWPSAGPEELVAAERRTQRLDREGSWAEAAAAAAEATRLAARTGLADIPPARWLERALPPGPSWLMLRAQQDLLLGAAAASAGKAEEALDHFQRGVARAPYDPRVLRGAARLKAIVGFDLATAEAEALRAIELERRQGEDPSPGSLRALQRVRSRKGAAPPRDGEPQRSDR